MPSLSEILNDPNYTSANAETKQAIFGAQRSKIVNCLTRSTKNSPNALLIGAHRC